MLSQLGPLFKATFRHAEESDTRQSIRPEDKKDGRKKKDEDRDDDSTDMWEDSTGVSVDALRTFLINFLNGTTIQTGLAGGQNPTSSTASTPGTAAPAPPPRARPMNEASARAAGAYQSMADKMEPHHYTPPPITDAPENAAKTDADLLHAGDIRLIHQLIADLDELDARGVMELTIEAADSFLESLKNAVMDAKSGR